MNQNRFISLSLLDHLLDLYSFEKKQTDGVAVIAVQHLLESTGSMFEAMIALGIPSDQIFVTGKLYSNDERTCNKLEKLGIHFLSNCDGATLGSYYSLLKKDCQQLWKIALNVLDKKSIHTVIVLDDGGMLLSTLPEKAKKCYPLIGIEQTSSGIKFNSNPPIPVINVARSLVKTRVEPAFISQAVIQKTRMRLIGQNPRSIGIIGFGTIGRGLFHDLKHNFIVKVYDLYPDNLPFEDKQEYAQHFSSLAEIYLHCDVIIGATGEDISYLPLLEERESDALLMSVSSGDVEFRSLLQAIDKRTILEISSLLEDIVVTSTKGGQLTILRGGTPVNFDNNIHSVLPEYIQLTRGLLFLAILQAINQRVNLVSKKGFIELDQISQLKLLQTFIDLPEVDLHRFEFFPPLEELLQKEIV